MTEKIIDIRKSHFNGAYSIRVVLRKDGKDFVKGIYEPIGNWNDVKKWCKGQNIVCPKVSSLRFFSDGFDFSYAWFTAEEVNE